MWLQRTRAHPFRRQSSSLLRVLHLICFIHSSVGGHLGCSQLLAGVTGAAIIMEYRCLFDRMTLLPLDLHSEVGLLDHKVVLFLVVFRKLILFFFAQQLHQFIFPFHQGARFPLLHIFAWPCYLCFFSLTILTGVRHVPGDSNLHFSDDWWWWVFFHIPTGCWWGFTWAMSIQVLCPLLR